MIKIEMLPAHHGDCLWIEYGSQSSRRRFLIDGGTAGTYKDLKKRVMQLPEPERRFELLIVTHIDADHIAGVLKLMEEGVPGLEFKDIWFNGWRHLPDSPLESLGPVQGERLTEFLRQPEHPWNESFQKKAVMVGDTGHLPVIKLADGMRLTLMSPSNEKLQLLKPVWKKKVKEAGLDPDTSLPGEDLPDTRPSRLERLGATDLPDIDQLADESFVEDDSEANGSSIAVLAEYGNRSVLLSGDAHPEVLKAGIVRLLTERGQDKFPLDAFKLPHHGSKANINKGLLEKILCSRYLVSTSGAYFKHPDDVAIARVIKYGGEETQLYFNYRSRFNEVWDEATLKQNHDYKAFYPEGNDTSLVVDLT